ncbi:Hypothetical Protein SiL_1951 [Sulfolobus islandicus LAL14/1]|uniref:Uncharacterized protein n=1 Tax=Saccharolobus islandicus LAL14/1 TaxID=1241935 RepID=M9UGR6_SACIS|nr:Hypothetical Protein SiL_1951 [Sulfolobus islandicus LAL14/1]
MKSTTFSPSDPLKYSYLGTAFGNIDEPSEYFITFFTSTLPIFVGLSIL